MRFEWGSPRVLLASLGVVLIAFVVQDRRSSPWLGALLILGAVLVIVAVGWSMWVRRHRRG